MSAQSMRGTQLDDCTVAELTLDDCLSAELTLDDCIGLALDDCSFA